MQANPSFRRFPATARALVAVALMGAACDPDPGTSEGVVTVRGRVSDGGGSQFTRLGGAGTIESTAVVTAYTVGDDGSLTAIGSAAIDSEGAFELGVPEGEERVIVQALSAEGDVVASAILESTGEAGDTVTCTPLDSESSLEAEVMLEMIATSGDAEAVNPVDVRVRIDSDTAVAVRAVFEDDGEDEGEATVEALAQAVLAAQATQLAAWSRSGFEITQQEAFELQMEASQALSEDLHDGSDPDGAWADFIASLGAALEGAGGLDEGEQAEAEAQAGLSFRMVVEARVEDEQVAWEATHAAARLEAEAEAAAVGALFAAADASSEAQGQCEQAGADLVAEVRAAASITALNDAWDGFEAALLGEASVQGSALGTYLDASGATALLIDAALASCEQSAESLETDVWSEVDLLLTGFGAIDAHAVASAVVEGWSSHRAAVEAAIAGAEPSIPSSDTAFAADVTVLATAGFVAAE